MKLVHQNFYSGPNIWSPQSGLLLIVEHQDADTPDPLWRPADHELANLLLQLHRIFPVAAESASLASPQALAASPAPVLTLLLALAEVVMRNYCVRPRLGNVIDQGGGQMRIFLPCDEPDIGLAAWILAMQTVAALPALCAQDTKRAAEELGKHYLQFRQIAYFHGLNQSTMALVRSALGRGIPHYRITRPGQLMQLGQGKRRKRIMETATEETCLLGQQLARDKLLTVTLLGAHGLPTPQSRAVSSEQEALEVARSIGYPVVAKPRSSGKGRGVTTNITTEAGLIAAVKAAAAYQGGVIVERFIAGHDHRLLVVEGHLVAAARRMPASVTGDGRHTLLQLIDALNRDPRRGMPFERLLEWVTLDDEAMQLIAAAGMTLDSIPGEGQRILLRSAANLSRGGSSIDVTDIVHPDNRLMAERVAGLIGLDVTGIDFLTPDISRSWRETPCAVLEVNATPGLRPHVSANPGRDVVTPIIEHLFPADVEVRIPSVGITGSVGKTTTCQMLAHIFAATGRTVALSTTQGAWIGRERIRAGDCAGGSVASRMLLDPRVEAGVFELARGGLVKKGMTLDAVDVGVVLNVHDNHVGLDGIHSREALARVKRLVVEHARKLAVLNADDPLCLAMRAHVQAPRLSLVSATADNPELQRHMQAGGLAAFLDPREGSLDLALYSGERLIGTIPAAAMPSTLEGRFRPAAINALFAMVSAWGAGVDFSVIRSALCSFHSDHEVNPGRMNLVEDLPYKVLITWADGPEAMAELADYVRTLDVPGKKRLAFAGIGNRPDSFILDSARAVAGAFSDFICFDQEDLRGRSPGETAGLLARGLRETGVEDKDISIGSNHGEGLDRAYARSSPGDLLVVVTYTGEKAWQKARLIQDKASRKARFVMPY